MLYQKHLFLISCTMSAKSLRGQEYNNIFFKQYERAYTLLILRCKEKVGAFRYRPLNGNFLRKRKKDY